MYFMIEIEVMNRVFERLQVPQFLSEICKKLKLVKLGYGFGGLVFMLEPIFAPAPAASKNDSRFKSYSMIIVSLR